jgi:hypothetical protein
MQTGPAGAIPSGTWIQEREQKVHAGRAFDADRDCLGEQGQISSLVSLYASSFSFDLCASLGAAVVAWTVVGSSCVWVSWCAHTPKKITVVICVVLYSDFTIIIIPFIILGLIVLGEGAEDTSPRNRSKSLGY